MDTLPSKLFPGLAIPQNTDVGFYDTVPEGFQHPVRLYLSLKTVQDNSALTTAGQFFDRVKEWDTLCRGAFLNTERDSEDWEMVQEYFDFYKDEAPEVFGVPCPEGLTLDQMVNSLALQSMASHGSGKGQYFVVDFTLGYDQLLCAYFKKDFCLDHIAWES